MRAHPLRLADEILLVVVGILIALQVNDWNERRQQRARGRHYLANIRTT